MGPGFGVRGLECQTQLEIFSEINNRKSLHVLWKRGNNASRFS